MSETLTYRTDYGPLNGVFRGIEEIVQHDSIDPIASHKDEYEYLDNIARYMKQMMTEDEAHDYLNKAIPCEKQRNAIIAQVKHALRFRDIVKEEFSYKVCSLINNYSSTMLVAPREDVVEVMCKNEFDSKSWRKDGLVYDMKNKMTSLHREWYELSYEPMDQYKVIYYKTIDDKVFNNYECGHWRICNSKDLAEFVSPEFIAAVLYKNYINNPYELITPMGMSSKELEIDFNNEYAKIMNDELMKNVDLAVSVIHGDVEEPYIEWKHERENKPHFVLDDWDSLLNEYLVYLNY